MKQNTREIAVDLTINNLEGFWKDEKKVIYYSLYSQLKLSFFVFYDFSLVFFDKKLFSA